MNNKSSVKQPAKPAQSSKTQSTQARGQRGGSGAGFVAGLLAGLLVALGVALYVTNAPMPFTSKTKNDRVSDKPLEVGQDKPDPNKALYGKDVREGRIGHDDTAPAPAVIPNASVAAPASVPAQPSPPSAANPPTAYYLQTGSFKNGDEADQLRARLALAGIEANIAQAEVDGKQVNRVRVGPFSSAEEAYRARARLTENGFEARLVKPTAPNQ